MEAILQRENESASDPDAGIARYLREVGRYRLLSRAEERTLLERIREGDRKALNRLVAANLKWVVAVSAEYRDRGLPLAELIAEGNLGLIRAALGFEPGHSFRFNAFAMWWIRQSLERALAEQAALRDQAGGGEDGEHPSLPEAAPAACALPAKVKKAVDEIREPGRTILKLCFGLDVPRAMSEGEIGHMLGTSAARIRRLKDHALRRLQASASEARS
jgi:RNA polymerase sigma factor (sigma-70 family)